VSAFFVFPKASLHLYFSKAHTPWQTTGTTLIWWRGEGQLTSEEAEEEEPEDQRASNETATADNETESKTADAGGRRTINVRRRMPELQFTKYTFDFKTPGHPFSTTLDYIGSPYFK
jgi:hypothetical protein